MRQGHGQSAYSDRRPVMRVIPARPGAGMEAHLAAIQVKVQDADEYAAAARAERDAVVRAAIEAGLTKYRIAKSLGLTQHAVTLILSRPEPGP